MLFKTSVILMRQLKKSCRSGVKHITERRRTHILLPSHVKIRRGMIAGVMPYHRDRRIKLLVGAKFLEEDYRKKT